MLKRSTLGVVVILLAAGAAVTYAQEVRPVVSPVISTATPMPRVIRYSGSVDVPAGQTVTLKFSLYENQGGGSAVWSESQQVTPGESGKYSVLLGAATESGLPQNVFSSAQAKWLGVTVGEGQEQVRTILVATPYSLEASDAQTLGGHPATDFVLSGNKSNALPASGTDITQINVSNGVTGGGTGPTVTLGLSSTYLETLGNEIYPQLSGTNKLTGKNTYTAGDLLLGTSPVLSAANVLGSSPVTATVSGNTVKIGLSDSALLTLGNSVYAQLGAANTFTAGQTFKSTVTFASGQTFPGTISLSANNTFTGSNTFSKAITFAASQTFPGAGTITGITTNSPLSGSGTSGSVALSLDTSKLETTLNGVYAQLGAANTFTKAITFASGQTFPGTVLLSGGNSLTGSQTLAGTDTISGSAAGVGSQGSASGQLTVTDSNASGLGIAVNATGASSIGIYASGGTAGVEGYGPSKDVSGTLVGTGLGVAGVAGVGVLGETTYTGSDQYGVGVEGYVDPSYAGTYLVVGVYGNENSKGGVGYGVIGTSGTGVGTYGETASSGAYGVWGINNGGGGGIGILGQGDTGVEGSSVSNNGVYGTTSATGGPAGIYGNSTATTIGGDNFPGIGISGNANGPSSWGVYGNSGGSSGIGIYGNASGSSSMGVYGQGTTGVYGYSSTGNGIYGDSDASGESGVVGKSTAGNGVYGKTSSATGDGVYGGNTDATGTGDGVHGFAAGDGFGVHAVGVSTSKTGAGYLFGLSAALWADSGVNINDEPFYDGAIVATADNDGAGLFANNSNSISTINVNNSGSGGKGTAVPVLSATGNDGACGMNSAGDVTCTGRLKTAVPLAGGTQQVDVYSVQSSENWFEDFGSAKLENGRVTVAIDAQFAKIVNTGVQYHVFLTPSGNCRGLYVASRSASGFEVRELGDGGSSVEFDYRIVAKRSGHETERLADATAEMHLITARSEQLAQIKSNGAVRPQRREPADVAPRITPAEPTYHPPVAKAERPPMARHRNGKQLTGPGSHPAVTPAK